MPLVQIQLYCSAVLCCADSHDWFAYEKELLPQLRKHTHTSLLTKFSLWIRILLQIHKTIFLIATRTCTPNSSHSGDSFAQINSFFNTLQQIRHFAAHVSVFLMFKLTGLRFNFVFFKPGFLSNASVLIRRSSAERDEMFVASSV